MPGNSQNKDKLDTCFDNLVIGVIIQIGNIRMFEKGQITMIVLIRTMMDGKEIVQR